MVNRVADGFASIVEGEFIKKSKALMVADLDKSGLDPGDLFAEPLIAPPVMQRREWVIAGYRIPYYDREGNKLEGMYRDRLWYKPHLSDKELRDEGCRKYRGPNAEQASLRGADARMPYLYPHGAKSKVGIICEGEKKAASAHQRFKVSCIGIGGCHNWSAGAGSGRVHDDILWWAGQRENILIIPDPDISTNLDISRGYSGLVSRLKTAYPSLTIRVIDPPGKLDDFLAENEDYTLADLLERDSIEDLAQSLADLASEYELSFKTSQTGVMTLHKSAYNIGQLLTQHPKWKGEIKYNVDDKVVELYGLPIRDGLHDHQICSYINRNLHLPDIGVKMVWEGLMRVAKEHEYSPAQDDVRACGKWDGVHRLRYIFGEGRTENEMRIAEAFVCGYVQRVMHPGCFWRIMTVLVGPQKVGKTGMALWLAGTHDRVATFHPGDFRMGNKDAKLRLSNCSIALFDDVDTFSHTEQGQLKSIISQTHTVERVAYGRSDEKFKRRGIMMGTANDSSIIPNDPTGNTRFAVIEVLEKQDFEWLNASREDIIAEAWHMVQKGWEPAIDFDIVTAQHSESSEMQDKLEEFLELLRDGKLTPFVLVGRSKKTYFKQDAFWQWMHHGEYRPKDWERKEFSKRAKALGIVYHDQNGADRLLDGTKLKRVWQFDGSE